MKLTLWFLTLVVCLTFIGSVPANAQAISGDLVGTVTDGTGAAIPNASVTATNRDTNVKATATTNSSGEYRIGNLLPGAYTVAASASGFGTSTLKDVPVRLNTTVTENLSLQIGTVSTSVEVSESAAVLDTTTAQIQNTYSTRQTQNLPNVSIGQGVINLSLLEAGVSSAGGVGVGTGPSVGGQRPRNNNYTIEGVDNNNKSVTGPQVFVPNDAVAEFTLLQNQFRAEYGHSSGGQFNTIVISGTNSVHGMLYDYLRNRDLNALNQTLANQGVFNNPRYDQNRLGGQVGGPIFKNKLFFFANFEYNPLGQASTVGSPVYGFTSAGLSTLSGIPGISKTNLGILQTYATASSVTAGAPLIAIKDPTSGLTLASIPTGVIPIVAPNFTNSYYGILSSDYNISDKDQLRGRYIYNKSDAINTGATLPTFYTAVPTRDYLATLAEYHTFNPNLTNELRVAYQRTNTADPVGNQTFAGLDSFPNLQFNDLKLQIGPNPNFPQFGIQNLVQLADAVTWIRGKHTLKVGYEFRDSISPQFFSQRVRGDYEYVSVASYLFDISPDSLAQRNVGGRQYYGNQVANYIFAQDSWRVSPRLTFDLGARYEITTVPLTERQQSLNAGASAPGFLPIGTPKIDPKGIAPRVGVAYTLDKDGNTVVRAGFGLAYDVLFDNLGLNTVPPQYAVTVDVTGKGIPNFLQNGGITAASLASGTSVASLRANTSSYIPDQLLPYSINYNFSIQHIFAKNYTFEARYTGTKGVHLVVQQQIDRLSPVTATNNIPTFLTAPSAATLQSLPLTVGALRAVGSLNPAYAALGFTSTITSYRPEGYSQYNGLALQLNKRFGNGLQYQAAYTWSHNIDNSTAEVASTYLTPRRAQNFNDLASEKASSALDHRHRVTISAIYDLPYLKGNRNWFVKNLVGNWQLAPIYTYESPEYYTVQSGIDSNLNGDSAPDRTIINPGGASGTSSNVVGLDAKGNQISLTGTSNATQAPIVAYLALTPNARYIRAGYGAYADGGRNTQPTRPINNIDLALLKRFSISERMKLELSGQALNVFNHAQFIPGSINNTGTVATFNAGTLSYVTAGSPTFNNPELAFSSNPRQIIVVAKFIF